MALKPTWARIHGLFSDKNAAAAAPAVKRPPASGSVSPLPASPVTATVQEWDWDLPPAAASFAGDGEGEEGGEAEREGEGQREQTKHVSAAASEDESLSVTLRQRRMALEEEVAGLRKTLLQEGNIHRALERALRRTAGVLPRLPAYVPAPTRKLLAEVAVLEEEVTNLEEDVVSLREDLYKEALLFSCATQKASAVAKAKAQAQTQAQAEAPAPAKETVDEAAVPTSADSTVDTESPKTSDIQLPESAVSDAKQGPRKDSVVAKLLQTGTKPQAPANGKHQGSQLVKAPGKAGAGRLMIVETKPAAWKQTSSRSSAASSAQPSPQLSPKVPAKPLPTPRTVSNGKGSKGNQVVASKPQKAPGTGGVQSKPVSRPRQVGLLEKENQGMANKNAKRMPLAQPVKTKSRPEQLAKASGDGPLLKPSASLAASIPSATPAATPSATTPAATPSATTPAATPSATPAATPLATPAATPSVSPAASRPGSPKSVATPKLFSLSSSVYLQDGVMQRSEANKLSEEMVSCLMDIYSKLAGVSSVSEADASSVVSRSTYGSSSSSRSLGSAASSARFTVFSSDVDSDPYGVCPPGMARDIGAYADYQEITAASFDHSRVPASAALYRRHRVLLKKLSVVNLRGLTHQQKLAFWINAYNVCMMHAFLENGIPSSPHKTFALMRKAVLNVGGYLLNPLAIEHFILRLPSQAKQEDVDRDIANSGSANDYSQQSAYGLQWPEPLVSFALSCGSRSSPAVRVYTPGEVEAELEVAKRDYLEAAIGITADNKIIIPKLLEWYLRDFAKDAQSLLEWISQQLPSTLQQLLQSRIESLEPDELPRHIEVMPYDFDFRYLFAC